MEKYWAIDYVGEDECELVVGDQLYATEEAARWVAMQMDNPDLYEVNWYTRKDLEEEVYNIWDGMHLEIDEDLQVHVWNW